jgi:soluble lytic murein transglycosylase-like protein
MKNTKLIVRSALIVALLSLAGALSACSKTSVVSDSAAPQSPAQQPATQTQPAAAQQQNPAQPAEQAAAQQPSPSPTLHPIMKQAQSNPGVPVSVPDSVRRPLNAEEMKKALEAMPPEVRARLQGMAAAPQGAKPQATPKK